MAEADASLVCERVITTPGDVLFLPRRTLHSARAVTNDEGHSSGSIHLTIGLGIKYHKSKGAMASLRQGHRRLDDDAGCAASCDGSCDPDCDDASCDDAGCDDASCDGASCDQPGCDGECEKDSVDSTAAQ